MVTFALMTWGELKAANTGVPDDTEIYLEVPDENGDIPSLDSCEVDRDGDLIFFAADLGNDDD